MDLDDEQALAVDALLSYGPGGAWVALESAVIEARQNGKSMRVLLPVTLFDLFLLEPDRIVWTAHLFRTARDAFDAFCTCIATAPELSRRVKNVSYGRGEEAIELHNGAKLEFLARSTGGGRGLGGKRVVMDEALILTKTAMGSMMPTLSARPDPQIMYGSSAGKETSDHLHRLVKRGRSGKDPTLIFVEWCAPGGWKTPQCAHGTKCSHEPGTPDCALDDETLWPLANHSLGKRITYSYVRGERAAMDAREFGRERLGWHEEPIEFGGAIDMALWRKLCDPAARREGDIAFGVDISPQRDFASIGMYGRTAEGVGLVRPMIRGAGVDWVIPDMIRLRKDLDPVAWAMGRGTYASLEAELLKNGFSRPEERGEPKRGDVAVVVGADMSAACGQMLDALREESFRVYRGNNDPQDPILAAQLDQAVLSARTKETADAIAWSRKDSMTDISPLVAVTVARWVYTSWTHLIEQAKDRAVAQNVW